MAVQKTPQVSTLSLKLQNGVNAAGSPVYVTRNYPCKATATDQDIMDVAQAIAGLQSYPLAIVERIDTAYLTNA